MSTLVLYYSYSGRTKAIAEELAAKESADIEEIKDVKRPSTFKAYTLGCFSALRSKPWPTHPLNADMKEYDKLILLAPIWAGNPPPAFNDVLAQIPTMKDVCLKMVSMSGKSNCRAWIEAVLENKGCVLESIEDIKA